MGGNFDQSAVKRVSLIDLLKRIGPGIMLADAIAHVAAVILISGAILLGELLVPFLGKAAPVVMGAALLAAGIEKPVELESRFIRWGCLLCIAFTAVICYSYGGSPTQLIFLANIATAIATPFGGFFVCRLIFRKDINGALKTPRILQICMVISYIFALIMTGSAIWKMLSNL